MTKSEEIRRLREIVAKQPEKFLRDIGCRVTTTHHILPKKDATGFILPYKNNVLDTVKSLLRGSMKLCKVYELCYDFPPQIVYQALHDMSQKKLIVKTEDGFYSWRLRRPKIEVKALEIPAEVAKKLMVLMP